MDVDKINGGNGNTYASWNLVLGSGEVGPTGATGAQGTSITVKGSVATVVNLPSSGNSVNDAYGLLHQLEIFMYGMDLFG
jgi:hypothetical protein